jgi:acyl-homoserine lactone synthase
VIEILSGVMPGENELLEQAFKLRHQIFVEELGWEPLRRLDGREIDQFDDADSTHFLAVSTGQVEGYFRSRPTAKPHLLSDVHSHLCDRPYPRSFRVLEWTRYCVTPARREGGAFAGVGSELIVAGLEWTLNRGIGDVVLEYHPAWIARFMGLGFKVHPLGLPDEIEGDPVIAVHLRFDQVTLERTRLAGGVTEPVHHAEGVWQRKSRRSVA